MIDQRNKVNKFLAKLIRMEERTQIPIIEMRELTSLVISTGI